MKKILPLIIFIILFIPNVKAENKKSVEVDSKSNTTQEVSQPTFNNGVVNINAKFGVIEDYIKYKVIINNSTEKDKFNNSISYLNNVFITI